MLKWTVLQVSLVVLAWAAAYVSFQLLARHLTGAPGPAWFELGCHADEGGSGGANCAKVLASRWSYWPPLDDSATAGAERMPVAFLGLVYFSMIGIWFVGIGRPTRSRRWVILLPAIMMTGGLIGSAFFTYIMFTRLEEWCPWCLATHVLNVLIAIGLVLLWPRAPEGQNQPASRRAEADDAAQPPQASRVATRRNQPAPSVHPTLRLVLVTLLAMGAVAFAQRQLLAVAGESRTAAVWQSSFTRCMNQVNHVRMNGPALLALWGAEPKQDLPARPDDPARKASPVPGAALRIVVFSDFECSVCRTFAHFLESQAQLLFAGQIRVVFKHFPLDASCNPYLTSTVHPHACAAARLAEAARLLGGNEAFWRVHDYLFEHQDQIRRGELHPEAVADDLGIDPPRFLEAFASDAVASRIREDTDHGKALGVSSTPAPFLDGRRVPPLCMSEIAFWDRIADSFWPSINQPRPESTRPPSPTAIPNTPDPPAAP